MAPSIPKVVHYIYWDFKHGNRPMPTAWAANVERNHKLSVRDEWQSRIWDQTSSNQIIMRAIQQYCEEKVNFTERPQDYDVLVERIYLNYTRLPGVVQSDFVRFAVVYYEGGLYADASDVSFHHSIQKFISTLSANSNCHFHVERYGPTLSFGNASLGGRTRSATVWGFLASLFNKLNAPFNSLSLKTQEHVYEFAGPMALTQYIRRVTDLQEGQMRAKLQLDHVYDTLHLDYGRNELISLCSPETLIGVDVPAMNAIHGVHSLEGSWKNDIPSELDVRGRQIKVAA